MSLTRQVDALFPAELFIPFFKFVISAYNAGDAVAVRDSDGGNAKRVLE